jgi:predicted SAM-dependent methyltransferase
MKITLNVFFRIFRSFRRRLLKLAKPFQQYLNFRKFQRLSEYSEIKLNLGAGPIKGVGGWTTVDYSGADICWDLKQSIPIEDSTVMAIYSSHLLEHLNFTEINNLLAEINRILVPGGAFRVCVPDASKYIKAYTEGFEFRIQSELYQPGVTNTGSFIDQVNYIAYMGQEHKFLFDLVNLSSLLEKHNFGEIRSSQYCSTQDDIDRSVDSIYLNCTKI